MGIFLSDTFLKSFSCTVNMFISIFMIQTLHNTVLPTADFLVISAETASWEITRK
jgi:hypothetical protein